ncbi:MAG: hypothetical protein RMJ14_05640 [Nitrososphaerota archaeon]|nr:hypothetical protein [Aigarchaeota archaeon]MDW8077096.1 hypothetical protein [Nitrososphaerota archaeon]
MRASLRDIIEDILAKIEDKRVIGLITYRHYAEELALYEKFGKCGFAISVVMADGGRITYHMLVEVEKDSRSKEAGGNVRYVLLEEEEGKRKFSVVKASYRSREDLLKSIDRIRKSFYRRILQGRV